MWDPLLSNYDKQIKRFIVWEKLQKLCHTPQRCVKVNDIYFKS